MRILYDDLWQAGTVVGSSVAPGFPAANSQQQHLIKTWRSTGAGDENLVLDAGAVVTADAVAVLGHNLTAGATVRIQANSADSWGSPAVSQLMTVRAGVMLHFLGAPVSYRYWRLRVQDGANPAGRIELGRVFLAQAFAVSVNGHSSVSEFPERHVRNDRVSFAQSDEPYADIGTSHREYDYEFRHVDQPFKDAMVAMFDTVGRHGPVVFTNFDDSTYWQIIEPIYALVRGDVTANWRGSKRWNIGLQIREVR